MKIVPPAAGGGLGAKPSTAGLRRRGGARARARNDRLPVVPSGADFDPTKEKAIAAAKAMAEE